MRRCWSEGLRNEMKPKVALTSTKNPSKELRERRNKCKHGEQAAEMGTNRCKEEQMQRGRGQSEPKQEL